VTNGRLELARRTYEQAVYAGDVGGLDDADRALDALEADVALARGKSRHARFLHERAGGAAPAEDPAELPAFVRAAELYEALGDTRGTGEALFWIGCLHQVIRRDDATAVPLLERSRRLAAEAGDRRTHAEALRHLGIAAHQAGRLDEARELLTESTRLRREIGAWAGVAANLVGLVYLTAAQGRPEQAEEIRQEALALARDHGAHAIVRQLDEAAPAAGQG
jgi:tetratricopeptide (TPR) repeat protein